MLPAVWRHGGAQPALHSARHELVLSTAEIAVLLKLWQNRCRASVDVNRIAMRHVVDLERRMAAMADMRDALNHLGKC